MRVLVCDDSLTPSSPPPVGLGRRAKKGTELAKRKTSDDPKLPPIPSTLPILPLRNTLAYPSMVLPLAVGIPRSMKLIEDALQGDRLIGLVGMGDGSIEEPGPDQVWQFGTVARIHRVVRAQEDTMQVIVQGMERFEIVEWLEPKPYLRANIKVRPDVVEEDLELDALVRSLRELAREVVALSPHLPDEVGRFLAQVEDPRHLVYVITANARVGKEEGQEILEADKVKDKIRILIRHLTREREILTLEQKIQSEAHEEMDKAQREYFLRQQLRAIRKELGDEEESGEFVEEYKQRILASGMPHEARKEVLRELKRLDGMPPQAAEYSLIKTYLDWMVEIPWKKKSEDRLDVENARQILDEDHYDLAEVKSRILEYLAVRKLITERDPAATETAGKKPPKKKPEPLEKKVKATPVEDVIGIFHELPDEGVSDSDIEAELSEFVEPEDEPDFYDPDHLSDEDVLGEPEVAVGPRRATAGTILCFVGPPGVGKTSLGQSIARALGREFTRMSLGGMRDEAEIRGHRRTYIGALPGRIIQGIKRAGTRNPVFMLDEVDKIGSDWRGDPASALLEVLDPAQNHAYRDHYLDVDFDLGDVMFIATANTLETIPEPLRDRMEIIQLEGYTDHDKLEIAKGYLVPRQVRSHGLREKEIDFSDEAILKIIHNYTRESGVRDLERQIGKICRKAAVGIASKKKRKYKITPKAVRTELKAERFPSERTDKYRVPGVATGLAVTTGGGDILYIEVTKTPGKGQLTLTGQLGEVMKESAQIAFNLVKSKTAALDIAPEAFEKVDVHVHVPAGAIPKDGPSAGVAMTAAIASLFTERRVRNNVGMTGEVTLRGRVLPVGGVKAKVLAAHRAGLDTVVLPKQNAHDLDELPELVKESMTFHPVDMIESALDVLLDAGSKSDSAGTQGANRRKKSTKPAEKPAQKPAKGGAKPGTSGRRTRRGGKSPAHPVGPTQRAGTTR